MIKDDNPTRAAFREAIEVVVLGYDDRFPARGTTAQRARDYRGDLKLAGERLEQKRYPGSTRRFLSD